MNKKIYFNDSFIHFTNDKMQVSHNQAIKFYELTINYEDDLKKIIPVFLKTNQSILIYTTQHSFKTLFNYLKSQFHYIEAAGGFIEKDKEFLFIHRHGRWDLPKGKLEKKETVEHAAIRECEEECAIKQLSIIKPLSSTFHIYPFKGAHALKQSYWFYMTSDYKEKLIPQVEESIDQVRWFKREEIKNTILSDTYYTIRDVVEEAME